MSAPAIRSIRTRGCPRGRSCQFTGTEKSPKGLGLCSHCLALGQQRKGKDGRMWVVTEDLIGRRRWKAALAVPHICLFVTRNFENIMEEAMGDRFVCFYRGTASQQALQRLGSLATTIVQNILRNAAACRSGTGVSTLSKRNIVCALQGTIDMDVSRFQVSSATALARRTHREAEQALRHTAFDSISVKLTPAAAKLLYEVFLLFLISAGRAVESVGECSGGNASPANVQKALKRPSLARGLMLMFGKGRF